MYLRKEKVDWVNESQTAERSAITSSSTAALHLCWSCELTDLHQRTTVGAVESMATTLSQNIPTTTDGSELAVKITEYHAGKVAFILDGVELG